MGAFNNISIRSHGVAAVLLATCLYATPAFAETAAGEQPKPQHAVSTSPSPPAALAPRIGIPPALSPVHSAPELPPLTRAAARLRIEEMSPIRWLAHYGNVSIGQRE